MKKRARSIIFLPGWCVVRSSTRMAVRVSPTEARMKNNGFPSLAGWMAGLGCLAAGRVPTDAEVTRKLQHILRTDPAFRGELLSLPWLEDFLKWLARAMRDPVLVGVAVAILLGLFFLVRKCLPYLKQGHLIKQLVPDPAELKAESPQDAFNAFYRQALAHSETGDYRPALVALHKATVEYLSTNVMRLASGKTYSNNDLKRRLKSHPALYSPFVLIANYAEIAGFSLREIGPADFARALAAFEQSFLQQTGKRGGQ